MSLYLDAIKARLAAATPGPWVLQGAQSDYDISGEGERVNGWTVGPRVLEIDLRDPRHLKLADAELIANAPSDLKALLEEVERLRGEVDGCVTAIESLRAERNALRERLREVAQILIAEVGAEGPMDAEDAARKAVARMERLRELADEKAHEAGLYARRMGEAQARARKSTPQDEELALLRSELQEQARLVGMGSEREARLMAQLEEARRELQGVMEALPVTTIAFTGDYGLYVRNCMSYLLLQELQKRGQE